MKHFPTPKMAVHAAYASPEIVAMIDRISNTIAEMRTANDARISEIEKKGAADPLTQQKVDAINASVSEMQKELADMATLRASLAQGGGAGNPLNAAQREHSEAFSDYFRRGADAGLNDLAVKAQLTSSSNPDGGYLVPTEVETAIDRVLATTSAMRRLARVLPIGSASYKKWVNVGGASSGWTNDKKSKSETSTPKLEQYEFPAHELYAFPFADNSTLEDGIIDIATWLSGEVDIEFARNESDGFINGDGDGAPRGIIGGYNIVANGARRTGQLGFVPSGSASVIDKSDAFIKLYHALKAGYRGGAVWLMNDLTTAACRLLKDGQGNYIWQTDFSSDAPFTLLGKPIETDDSMPDIAANSFSVSFGNFKAGYLIVDRRGTTVLRDSLTVKGKTGFYTTKRVGGGVQNFEAIKFLKTST